MIIISRYEYLKAYKCVLITFSRLENLISYNCMQKNSCEKKKKKLHKKCKYKCLMNAII